MLWLSSTAKAKRIQAQSDDFAHQIQLAESYKELSQAFEVAAAQEDNLPKVSDYQALAQIVLPFAEKSGVPFDSVKSTHVSRLRALVPRARDLQSRDDSEAMAQLMDMASRLSTRKLRRWIGRQRVDHVTYTILEGDSSSDHITLVAHLTRSQFERLQRLLGESFRWNAA